MRDIGVTVVGAPSSGSSVITSSFENNRKEVTTEISYNDLQAVGGDVYSTRVLTTATPLKLVSPQLATTLFYKPKNTER